MLRGRSGSVLCPCESRENGLHRQELSSIYFINSLVQKQLISLLSFDSVFQGCSFSLPDELVIFSLLSSHLSWHQVQSLC